MIGNAIVISDANILIDLLTINLIEEFCLLPVSKYTSQFVVQEIKEPIEQEILRSFLDKKQIIEQEFEFEELVSINELNKRDGCSSLSFTDCSVWYLSKKLGGLLLTGDRQLRLIAESDKIPCVRDTLYLRQIDRAWNYYIIHSKPEAQAFDESKSKIAAK